MTDLSPKTASETAETEPYPSQSYAWFVIAVLFAVTLFSQLDRQLPALLVKPIRAEFGISDTGFSLLQGYAFALVYTIAGIPLGRLVDRAHRINLIIIGLIVWSGMTIASGFAGSFRDLLICRVGVGIGEAVLAPAAYSIIADYVAPHRRGRALGVYYVSLAIGSGASLLLGGLIFKFVDPSGMVVPGIGQMDQWRIAFLVAGAPGFVLVGALLMIREPKRREEITLGLQAEEGSIAEFFAYLRKHASTYSRVLTYPATIAVVGYGALAWAPALFERRFGMERAEIGLTLGMMIAVCGLTGSLISAFLSDRWRAKGVKAARLRVTLVGWAFILPMAAFWPLGPTPTTTLIMLGLLVGGAGLAQAAAPAVVQEITPNRMRGQAIAIYLLIGGLFGIGLGPTIVALATDFVFKSDDALPYALSLACTPIAIIGFGLCLSGLKPYQRTLDAFRQTET
jgi:MFS family permease